MKDTLVSRRKVRKRRLKKKLKTSADPGTDGDCSINDERKLNVRKFAVDDL